MRINHESLLRLAEDAAQRAVKNDRTVIAAYLFGSANDEKADPVMGGTADIDLVFVHDFDPPVEREIIPISNDVHLDVLHHARPLYRQPRLMRTDPFLGYIVYYCRILHDPRHLVDFAQAGVRGLFFRVDNVILRSRASLASARDSWMLLQRGQEFSPDSVDRYLNALHHAANAIAILGGAPLVVRRLLVDFPGRAEAQGEPGLAAGLSGLMGIPDLDRAALQQAIPGWEIACEAAALSKPSQPDFHPARREYFRQAIHALLSSPEPAHALYPLLASWTAAVQLLQNDPPQLETWHTLLNQLKLNSDQFPEKLKALDAYLDRIEDVLDAWARERGAD